MPRPRLIEHPAWLGPVRATIEQRPPQADDEALTAQTIQRMSEYAREDSTHPIIRRAAYEAAGQAQGKAIAEAVHRWIRQHVIFRDDAETAAPISAAPELAEVLIRPVDLLTMPQPAGDCDDFSMLAAAMLRALGIQAAFHTVAADETDPTKYSHVYVLANIPGAGRVAIDASHGPRVGWEARAIGKARTWPIDQEHTLNGLGYGLPEDDTASGTAWWQDLIKTGMDATSSIMKARYSTPQVEPGTYLNTPQYSVTRAGENGYIGPYVGGSNSGLILLLGIGAVVLLLATRK